MMQQLKAKLKKQGGFTLIEMLIVVAIIAILIAISIPLVNGALEKARDATDQANERAAKAVALLHFMGVTDDKIEGDVPGSGANPYKPGTPMGDGGTTLYYDAVKGCLTYTMPTKGYGQCVNKAGCYGYKDASSKTHIGCVLSIQVDANGIFTPKWEPVPTTP